MRQIDLDWAARIMIARHGKEAAAAAQRRVTNLLNSNDIDVAAIWTQVERAIRGMQGPACPAGDDGPRAVAAAPQDKYS